MIKPLNNKIIVEPEYETRVLATMPIQAHFGKAIAVGQDVKCIKVGDRLAYIPKWALKEISDGDKIIYFVSEDNPFLLGIDDGKTN